MQGILRNPIAEPSILGITQGSVMFVAIAPCFLCLLRLVISGQHFGCRLQWSLVFLFAVKYAGHPDVSRILLAERCFEHFLSICGFLSALIQNRSQELAFWIAGGFRQATGVQSSVWELSRLLYGSFLLLSGKVNLLSLGDEAAISTWH